MDLPDLYLDWCCSDRSDATFKLYVRLLQSFCSQVGAKFVASDLRPKDVKAWIGAHDWSNSTKSTAVQTLTAAFRWLVREGHLENRPWPTLAGRLEKAAR